MSQYPSINSVVRIAKEAGKAIMKIYNDPKYSGVVEKKSDDSPLTLADKAAHEVIEKELSKISSFPIFSEEGRLVDFEERKNWKNYWLVDPLDGTKEFIKRNGEFTVNIALIENKKPIWGVIFVPVKDTMFYGNAEIGAFKQVGSQNSQQIQSSTKTQDLIAVRSKSHASQEEDELLKEFNVKEFISVGSSLKFCMIAEGKANIYYRHNPTMEWDTAAGHAIAHASGANVFRGNTTEEELEYNRENLRNGNFLCLANSLIK